MSMTSFSMLLEMDDRTELSQLVAVMSLGLCAAIEGGSVSIEEAERRLFNPQMLSRLGTMGVSEASIEIVHLRTELEDVWSLVPDRLGESLAEIRSRALKFLNQEANQSDLAAWPGF
jgi:Protein of unknown function (DUF3969)